MNDLYSRAPHRPAAPADAHSPHAALLIDFDNVTMGIRSNLGQELRKLLDSDIIRGKVSVQRAYADWRRYPQYIASLSESSIDLIFAPAYGSTKKNATDIRLAIDALEIVFIRPEIGTFILLSGDSDFSSLVLKLKEYGKYVIGVGIQESSSDLLVQNCDEYYSYNSLSGLTSASDMKNIEKHDPWELAAKAIRRMTERGDVMRSDRFKQVMLELDPSFNEKSIGFSKFNRFLTESASRGILDLHKAANGQYEVAAGVRVGEYAAGGSGAPPAATPAPEPAQAARKEADESRGRRSRAQDERTRSARAESRPGRRGRPREADMSREAPPSVDEARLRAAYDLLRTVVAEKVARGGSVRDSEVKRKMVERDPDFDEAALGFRKFSRFLRQAHDEEVINLERTGEGNYRIAAVPGGEVAARDEPAAETPVAEEEKGKSRGRKDRRERSGRRGRGSKAAEKEAEAESTPAEEAAEESTPEPAAQEQAPEMAPSRLSGRRRRSPKPQVQAGAGVVPGPVDTKADEAKPAEEGDGKPDAAPTRAGSRTMGRFRRGSRGPTGPTPSAQDDATAAPAAAASELSGDQANLVERMARGYQGVGRRTAERLVEELGDSVLEVIDDDPARIEKILPKGRAQAVIEGRRAEREGNHD
jgi:uncharacterized LabA/DUF88 family protein